MLRTALFALAIAIPATIIPLDASAQDIAPVISPGQAAEGIFHRSVAEGQARRIREGRGSSSSSAPCATCLGSRAYPVLPGTTPAQARACYSRPGLRAKGGNDAQLQKLESLCEQAGY